MTEKPKLTFEEELLDLQRAQFNLAKSTNNRLGCLTWAVVTVIVLSFIVAAWTFLETMVALGSMY